MVPGSGKQPLAWRSKTHDIASTKGTGQCNMTPIEKRINTPSCILQNRKDSYANT